LRRLANAWGPPTNIPFGPSAMVMQQPLDARNRFYRAARLP
jgi:hypothetical protein